MDSYNHVGINDLKSPPSTITAYALWVFFGWIGAHRFYLGYVTSAILIIVGMWGGLALVGISWIGGLAGVVVDCSLTVLQERCVERTVDRASVVMGLGYIMSGCASFLWFLDMFLIPSMVKKRTSRLLRRLK